MSNRSLLYMTVIVLVGIGILLGLNFYYILQGTPQGETYLKYNDVKGVAAEYKGELYTFNFEQQNAFIGMLNRAVKTDTVKEGDLHSSEIAKIIIYQFNAPDILLTPVAYVDQNLVFTSPQLAPKGYLMDITRGELQSLLSTTYDH